jgi:hypothetical protein
VARSPALLAGTRNGNWTKGTHASGVQSFSGTFFSRASSARSSASPNTQPFLSASAVKRAIVSGVAQLRDLPRWCRAAHRNLMLCGNIFIERRRFRCLFLSKIGSAISIEPVNGKDGEKPCQLYKRISLTWSRKLRGSYAGAGLTHIGLGKSPR